MEISKFIQEEEKVTMSSREIAELTGKRHYDVLRDIRTIEPFYIQVYGDERKFALVEYKDTKGEMRPEYHLNKSQTLYLVSGYDPVLRAKVQKRWEQLEAERQNPDMLIYRGFQAALGKIEALEEKLEVALPLIEYSETVQCSVNSIEITEFANTIGIGRNTVFQILREIGFLKSKGENRNLPYQQWLNQELFEVENRTHERDGVPYTHQITLITGKGQTRLAKRLREYSPQLKLF